MKILTNDNDHFVYSVSLYKGKKGERIIIVVVVLLCIFVSFYFKREKKNDDTNDDDDDDDKCSIHQKGTMKEEGEKIRFVFFLCTFSMHVV